MKKGGRMIKLFGLVVVGLVAGCVAELMIKRNEFVVSGFSERRLR